MLRHGFNRIGMPVNKMFVRGMFWENIAASQKAYQEFKDPNKGIILEDAIKLVKSRALPKFDDILFLQILINYRKGYPISGWAQLPHGAGFKNRILAFVPPEQSKAASDAGAFMVGGRELVEQIEAGHDISVIDSAVATPEFDKLFERLTKHSVFKRIRPVLKNGTLTENVPEVVNRLANSFYYSTNRNAQLELPVGKLSFPLEHIQENVQHILLEIANKRPVIPEKVLQGSPNDHILSLHLKPIYSSPLRLSLTQFNQLLNNDNNDVPLPN